VYKIKDFGNEILDGIFYETELQEVAKKGDVYRVMAMDMRPQYISAVFLMKSYSYLTNASFN
jgi:hypothetical protein